MRLADLYDADKRATDPLAKYLAGKMTIPHPIGNTQYADGHTDCTHARKHEKWDPACWPATIKPMKEDS